VKLRRRHVLQLAVGAAALPVLPRFAKAQAYPSRPVRMIVPFPAGNAPDIVARLIGQWLSDLLGQPVIIDNRPGGNTIIGTEVAAKAAPDGYTLVIATSSHASNPGMWQYYRSPDL